MESPEVDLSTCDREAIHLQPAIQNVGFLIAYRPMDLKIQVVSENISTYLGQPFQTMMGQFLSEVLPANWVQENGTDLRKINANTSPFFLKQLELKDGMTFSCYFYFSEEMGILELEPVSKDQADHLLEEKISEVLSLIQKAPDLTSASQALANGVRLLTDLDRVMVYKFLPPVWHGEVIGEARIASAHSFMGHRFPASDIPKPARELYLRNQLRFIHDSREPISPLYFGDPKKANRKLDMQDSRMRAVAPVHLNYLRNMGVISSFSVAIIVNESLWGLLTCHHLSALRIEPKVRTACALLCKAFSLRVQSDEKLIHNQKQLDFETSLRKLISELKSQRDIEKDLLGTHSSLLPLFRASGAALVSEKNADIVGITPPVSEIQKMIPVFKRELLEKNNNWYLTTRLSDLNPDLQAFRTEVSGLLAIKVSDLSEKYLVFFRPEVVQTIEWGGDPRKNLLKRDYQGVINPRESFDTWQETVRGQSLDWEDYEIDGIKHLKDIVFDTLLVKNHLIQELNEKILQKGSHRT